MPQSTAKFKAHYFSALARSLFTNSSQIFINSVFVNTLGGKSYSDLFFFASLFTIVYYVYFAVRGERQAYWLYKTVLILSFIGLLLFFFQPLSKPVLYYFAVAVVVVDLIGTNLGPIVLQASVNPAIFRELFQRIVSVELVARISAAGFVCLLSQFHLPQCYFALAACTLIAHFTLFGSALGQIRDTAKATDGQNQSAFSFFDSIKSSLHFILSNSLARIALTIMVWTHVTKFLVEYLFYQVTASHFPTAPQIASFVSATTMTMILSSLIIQRLIGKKLSERLQLSTLFSIQPVNILLLGSAALLFPPFWLLVMLMVTYQCINRSIQLPVSRQCLLPVPRAQRGSIASLISLFMAVAALATSGAMSALKGTLGLHDFLLVLLFLSTVLFFLITRMDAFYIRNLWSFYREGRSGVWSEQPFASELCAADLPALQTDFDSQEKQTKVDLQTNSILQAYAGSYNRSALDRAAAEHLSLLNAAKTQSALLGMRIAFVSGFPWFRQLFGCGQSAEDPAIRMLAINVCKVNACFCNMQDYSSYFRRQIKALALDYVESESSNGNFSKLQNVLLLSDHDAAERLVRSLRSSSCPTVRELLLSCVDAEKKSVNLKPLIEAMAERPYVDTVPFREILANLSESKNNADLLTTIRSDICCLKEAKFSLWSEGEKFATRHSLQKFMHALFLDEYRLSRHGMDGIFSNTISELAVLSKEEGLLLADMHLEYLKTSELFADWVSLIHK